MIAASISSSVVKGPGLKRTVPFSRVPMSSWTNGAQCRPVRTAGVRAWRHTRQPHFPHQALDPFTIDIMACCFEKNHHLTAAVERMAGVFFVDQTTEEQIAFIDQSGLLLRVDR